jgi:hypothetical protein
MFLMADEQRIANARTQTTQAAPLSRKIGRDETYGQGRAVWQPGAVRRGLLVDCCVSDPAVAGRLADDLLAAQKQHLPQFA